MPVSRVGQVKVIVMHNSVINPEPTQEASFLHCCILPNIIITKVIPAIISKRPVFTGGISGE